MQSVIVTLEKCWNITAREVSGLNRNERRSRELHYRQHPKEIFASVGNIKEVSALISGGATKLAEIIGTQGGVLFDEFAALIWVQLVSLGLNLSGGAVDEEALRAQHTLGKELAAWCNACAENSIRFFRQILRGLMLEEPPTSSDVCLSMIASAWFAAQHNPNFLLDVPPALPTTAIRMLYAAAYNGNEEACLLLDDMWQLMFMYHSAPGDFREKEKVAASCYWLPPRFGYLEFVAWQQRHVRVTFRECGIDRIVAEGKRKMPQILAFVESLWEDILLNARRGIRPDGSDAFFVSGPWEKFGIGYRYFYPATGFPEVSIGASFPCQGGSIWSVSTFSPEVKQECIENGPFGILSYLANLIAYREILCRPPAKRSKRAEIPRPETEMTCELVRIAVREYERTLPPGQRCSSECAEAFRARFNRELAEGKTFVSEHMRSLVPGTRLIEGPRGLPRPSFSVNMEAIIAKL